MIDFILISPAMPSLPPSFRLLSLAVVAAFVWQLSPSHASGQDANQVDRGELIYHQHCAACHGNDGQGVEGEYEMPLVGDATIDELAEIITETMPAEDPDLVVGDASQAVAQYVHLRFYSEEARIRNRPPQVQLSRLTANQFRQSLTDLYAHFGPDPQELQQFGVHGVYYNGKSSRRESMKIDRIDSTLDFDFGKEGPGEGIDAAEYLVRWEGSLRIKQSGRYELVLRSSCSFVMDFGGRDRELINNHVQSEGRTEFRKFLWLTAGHDYPFSIVFVQRKRKTEQPPAWINFSWVPPGGIEQVVPHSNLIAQTQPSQFSLQAKLPADDRSYGYQRGIAISRDWDEATTTAAIEFAEMVVTELWPSFRRQNRGKPDENRQQMREFLEQLLRTAFRGALDDAMVDLYINRQIDRERNDADAIRRVVVMALKSPYFLYPSVGGSDQSRSQRAANLLSLILHDSLPADRWLITKIEKEQLDTEKQFRETALSMIRSQRGRQKTREFLAHWLGLDPLADLTKDEEQFAAFTPEVVADLQLSMEAFLDDFLTQESCDFRQLLQADWTFTTERLAAYYGPSWDAQDSAEEQLLHRTVGSPDKRAGLLTHPLLMSQLAHHRESSPIHRGVTLYKKILGRNLNPPQAAFAPLDPQLHPELTTRQRVELQTADENCQVCHQRINSVGFTLENFDPTGRYRELDNAKPVDPSGQYSDRAGNLTKISGPRELADYLAASSDCHRSFVESAFEYFVKQPIAAYGPDTQQRLIDVFVQSDFDVRELLVAIAWTVASHSESSSET